MGMTPSMAPPISDAVVVDVLRRTDRLLAPFVERLGRPPALPRAERDQWWADRVPVVAAGVAAAPRFLGRLADLLPLQNTVGTAVQSLVVLGVANEHDVKAPADRVALLARVLLDRDLPAERVEPLLVRARGTYREDALGRPGERGAVRTLWRVTRLLSRIDDALDARPKGRLHHRFLSNLPVVGVLGGYAAEREGLRKAAAAAAAVLEGRVSG
jgi:hypothetical protein